MQHKDLVDFIHEKHLSGASKTTIKKTLLGTGWSKNDVDAAFDEYARASAPSPKNRAIAADTDRSAKDVSAVEAPYSAPDMAQNKTRAEAGSPKESEPRPPFVAESTEEKDLGSFVSGNNIYFLVIAAISVLLFSGSVLGYYILYPKPENILSKSITAFSSEISGAITNTFSITVSDKKNPDSALISFRGAQRIYSDLSDPGSARIVQLFNSNFEVPAHNEPAVNIGFGASILYNETGILTKFTDINLKQGQQNTATETSNTNENPLAEKNESFKKKLEGRWLTVEPADLGTLFQSEKSQTTTASVAETKKLLYQTIDLAQKTNIFDLARTKRGTIENKSVYIISGKLNKQGIKTFLVQTDELTGQIAQGQNTEDKEKMINAFLENIESSFFEFWVGRDDFLPYRITAHIILRGQVISPFIPFGILDPKDGNMSVSNDPRTDMKIDLIFGEYGKTTVEFEEPENIKPFKEIIDSLSSAFVEEAKTKLNK